MKIYAPIAACMLPLTCIPLATTVLAADHPPTPNEILAKSPDGAWLKIADDDLLVMQLAPDAAGKARRVVIQLMPQPFAQQWGANIRTLALAHWWDGTSINRVQDNYVVQWGDPTEKKALPDGIVATNETGYAVPFSSVRLMPLPYPDSYARKTGFIGGWPVASDGKAAWPLHCYGMVGVGRNLSPDAGTGAELYTVIGQAPRHLDRNIALAGRVIAGMEYLSSLPRGTGTLGFYEDPAQRIAITSVRLASDLPEAERPHYLVMDTDSDSFSAYAHARANRDDDFFIRPAGGVDICNVPVPVTVAK